MNRPPKKTVKTIAVALGGIFLSLATSAYAAGLGKLSVTSLLGQPLSAEIDLVSLQPGEFEVLTARVASPEAYTDARIEYSPLLRQIRFSIERKADGSPVLKMTSAVPINEPFLDILVEVTWPAGKLVREYPILLDPPGFNEAKIQAPVTAPVPSRPAATAVAPSPAATKADGAAAAVAAKGASYGPVKRGDTLSKIASEMKGNGISLDQMLVALFRENKQAFANGNMNLLKTGQILRIPSASDVAKIAKDEAQKEVRVQVADWKTYREQIAGTVAAAAAKPAATNVASGQVASSKPVTPPPASNSDQLKIAKADTAQSGATSAPDVKGGVDAAKGAAAKEDAIAKEKTLAEAKARIEALEKQKLDAQKLVELKAPLTASPADTTPTEVPPVPAAVPAPAAPVAKKPDAPKVPPPPEPELMDTVMENLPIIAGVGGAAVIGAGLFALMRRRKNAGGPNSSMAQTSSLMPSEIKMNTVTDARVGGLVDTGNSSFLTDFDKIDSAAIVDTDEVDPIAEAEVYIAYGRDAQAEEILKEALVHDKGRHDISMKLLEIYHARKSASAFEPVAREIKEAIGEASPMWATVASMGASIDPSNALYQGATGNVEASSIVASGADAVATDSVGDASQRLDIDFDLDLDDSATIGITSPPAAAPAAADKPTETAGLDFDLALPDSSAAASAAAPAVADAPTETAGLDFDLALPDSSAAAPAVADTPTETAGLDFDLALPDSSAAAPAAAPAVADTPTETAGLDFDLALLDSPTEAVPAVVAASAAAPAATSVGADVDFDLPSLSLDEPSAAPSVDLPVSEVPVKPASIPLPNIDLSGLSLDLDTPAGAAEPASDLDTEAVTTKLELAKAYVEIGDSDGAKEILLEVLQEGSLLQQDEAKKILSGL
jgi:pilus assembly protein FimV